MEAAIRMVNEFLPEGKLIVYTQGRKYPRAEEFANGTGSCQKMPLVVLIDEGSASASEIFHRSYSGQRPWYGSRTPFLR